MPSGFINGDLSSVRPRGKSGKGNVGSFATYNDNFTRMVRDQALLFQQEVVAEIKKDIKRPGAGNRTHQPGRLAQVTASDGNHEILKGIWRVGIPKYLDSSISKYWRTIELGTKATWSTPFTSLALFGNFRGQNFIPLGNREQRLAAIERGDKRIFHPGHQVEPMNAYRKVWNRGWADKITREFSAVVQIHL